MSFMGFLKNCSLYLVQIQVFLDNNLELNGYVKEMQIQKKTWNVIEQTSQECNSFYSCEWCLG